MGIVPHPKGVPMFPPIPEVSVLANGDRYVWDVAPDAWWFPGHFPERPITPGVLVCRAAATAALAANGNPDATVVGITSARFKGMAVPGDQVVYTTDLSPNSDGTVTAKVRSTINGTRNFDGVLTVADKPLDGLDVERLDPLTGAHEPRDPATVIPHRPPFLFLSTVDRVDFDSNSVDATWEVTGAEPFMSSGVVPDSVLIESAAQACGFIGGMVNPGQLMLFASIRNATSVPTGPQRFTVMGRTLSFSEMASQSHVQVHDASGEVVVDALVTGMTLPPDISPND